MSHEQLAPGGRPTRTFEKKSDHTFMIILGVGIALVAALGLADWASKAGTTQTAAKQAATVQAAKTSTTDPVYKCADGRVSFKPCS